MSNPCMIFLSGIPNSLVSFLAHLPRLSVTETPINIKHDKKKRCTTSFSIKFPLSVLFEELANFAFAVFTWCGARRSFAVRWTGRAVDRRSVVFEEICGTHLTLSPWTSPRLLTVVCYTLAKYLHSTLLRLEQNWASKHLTRHNDSEDFQNVLKACPQ